MIGRLLLPLPTKPELRWRRAVAGLLHEGRILRHRDGVLGDLEGTDRYTTLRLFNVIGLWILHRITAHEKRARRHAHQRRYYIGSASLFAHGEAQQMATTWKSSTR